jgi:alpha-1,2-mannosyltransferase
VNTSVTANRMAAAPGQRPDARRLLVAGAIVAAISLVAYLAAIVSHPWHDMLKGFDLQVYLDGGWNARHDPAALYTWHLPKYPGIQYTYTPFASLLFAVERLVPFRLLMSLAALVGVAALGVTVWIAFRSLGWRSRSLLGATLLLGGLALWLEPVQRGLFLGQVELVLMALIVWDMCQDDRRRWKGAATGIAAGIKLVPGLFIVYLLLTRRYRAAAVAAGAFVVTMGIGFVFLPHESSHFWAPGYFLDASRTGFVGATNNQSLRGIITRLAGSVGAGQAVWLPVAAVTVIAGLAAAVALHRRGRTFEGLMTCALTGLLVSPISWDHHWVWIVPGLAVLCSLAVWARAAAARAGWIGAAIAVAIIFGGWPKLWTHPVQYLQGGLIWYAPTGSYENGDHPWYPEYHWHGLALLAGNLYVLAGCALFVLAVVAAVRVWRAGAADS